MRIHIMAQSKVNRGQSFWNTIRFTMNPRKIRRQPHELAVAVGIFDGSDSLGKALHSAATSNKTAKLKRILETDIDIEYPNSLGQTPLFCACLKNYYDTAAVLLKHGANPNTPDINGVVPMHVVCFNGNVKLLCRLIDSGGDLSICCNKGEGVFEWAWKNPLPKSRKGVLEFLDKLQQFGEGIAISGIKAQSHRALESTSVMGILNHKTESLTSLGSLESNASQGYGVVYPYTKIGAGIVSVVPLISERMLSDTGNGTFDCSLDFQMKEMMWASCPVLVKKLMPQYVVHKRVKMITNEAEKCGKLRHPNILLIMALCQSKTLDMMFLVFENASEQSLHHVLHGRPGALSEAIKMQITYQLCYVLEYIHNQGYIHCGLSSKAVYLAAHHTVKLGNFEFMMESSELEKGMRSFVTFFSVATGLYYWMAPEVMMGSPPSFSSDVYSYSCIVWEIFRGLVPWSWLTPEQIYQDFEGGKNVPLSDEYLPRSLKFIRESLKLGREERQGRMASVSYLLKSLEVSFWNRNKTENAVDDILNPQSSQNSKQCNKQGSVKQDVLYFDSSDQDSRDDVLRDDNQEASYSHQKSASAEGPVCSTFCKLTSDTEDTFLRQDFEGSGRSDGALLRKEQAEVLTAGGCLRRVPSMSVKELARFYQQYISQHKLRQAILKGSTNPHGSCPDLDSHSSSLRWHSLPATLPDWTFNTDSSKNWTTDVDESTKVVSELGDLSSTPKLKSCSTPEGPDHPIFHSGGRFPKRRMRGSLFQQKLRLDFLDRDRKKIQDGELDISEDEMIDDPESLKKIVIHDIKQFQLAEDIKSKGLLSSHENENLDLGDVNEPNKPTECRCQPGEMLCAPEISPKTFQGPECERSDLSWDLTHVTQLEDVDFLRRCTRDKESVPSANVNQCKTGDEKDITETLNSTFTIEDDTKDSGHPDLLESDPVWLWVNSKLEAIRKKAVDKKRPGTENGDGSSMDFDEELSKEDNNPTLDLRDNKLIQDAESESCMMASQGSTCEFEFQEFYIDDDLSADLKSESGDTMIEDLNRHMQSNLHMIHDIQGQASSNFSIEPKIEKETVPVLSHPPLAVVKPKRKGVRWRESLSRSTVITREAETPSSASASGKGKCSEVTVVPCSDKHRTSDGSTESLANDPAELKSAATIGMALQEKGHSLTQESISLLEEKQKITEGWKEKENPFTWLGACGNKNYRKDLKLDAKKKSSIEDLSKFDTKSVAMLPKTKITRPRRISKPRSSSPDSGQGPYIDQSTQVDVGCEKVVSDRRTDQEVQVAFASDGADSDEWVNKKLKIIQDRIKRRKHRLTYCISSDEDDGEDRQQREMGDRASTSTFEVYNAMESLDLCHGDPTFQQQVKSHHKTLKDFSTENYQASFSPVGNRFTLEEQCKSDLIFDKLAKHEVENQTDARLANNPGEQAVDFPPNENKASPYAPEKPPRLVCKKPKRSTITERVFYDLNRNNSPKGWKNRGKDSKTTLSDGGQSSYHHSTIIENAMRESHASPAASASHSQYSHRSLDEKSIDTLTTLRSNSVENHSYNTRLKTWDDKVTQRKAEDVSNAFQRRQAFSDSRVNPHRAISRDSKLAYSNPEVVVNRWEKSSHGNGSLREERDELVTDSRQQYEDNNDSHDHCLVVDLGCSQAARGKSFHQSSGSMRRSRSGVHKFYLPKESWSHGCQAKLRVQLSPTNPCKHHITTTATDPESGRTEILLEEVIETNNLQSSFNLK